MRTGSSRCDGYAYLVMLGLVALLAAATGAAVPVWETAAKRESEQQLLRAGAAYVAAIESYRRHAPGSAVLNPRTLDELLIDSRFPRTVRHLRRVYPDPMKPDVPWVLIRDTDGRIAGVHSSSDEAPFRTVPVDLGIVQLAAVRKYSDWKFVVQEAQR